MRINVERQVDALRSAFRRAWAEAGRLISVFASLKESALADVRRTGLRASLKHSADLQHLLALLVLAGSVGFVLLVLLPVYWSPSSRVYASSLGYPSVMRTLGLPMEVELEPVRMRRMSRVIAAEGNLAYLNTTAVRSEVPGIVTEILVEAGQKVLAGDALLYVNPGGHTTRMFTLRRSLRHRELEQARVRMERARALYQRGVLSKAEFDDISLELRRAETAADLAMEEYAHSLRSRSATVTGEPLPWSGASQTSQRVEILATITGTVIRRDVQLGENLIDLRTPLAIIGDRLVFQAQVDQRHAGLLGPGDVGRIYLRGLPGTEVPASVVRMGHEVETVATRGSRNSGPPPFTFSVWMSIPDSLLATGRFLPGMTGYVLFEQDYAARAVPEAALMRYSGRSGTVLAVDDSGRLEVRNVTYTGSEDGWVAIESPDLPEGSLVVVSGSAALKPGDRVVVPPAPRAGLH